jgi:hypothetical protein
MFDSLVVNFSYGTYKTGSAAAEMDTHGANHGHTFARDDSKLVSPWLMYAVRVACLAQIPVLESEALIDGGSH